MSRTKPTSYWHTCLQRKDRTLALPLSCTNTTACECSSMCKPIHAQTHTYLRKYALFLKYHQVAFYVETVCELSSVPKPLCSDACLKTAETKIQLNKHLPVYTSLLYDSQSNRHISNTIKYTNKNNYKNQATHLHTSAKLWISEKKVFIMKQI